MRRWIVSHQGVVLLLGVFLLLNVAFLFISPDTIVQYIGVENTYLMLFLMATFGGVNVFTGGVLYATIIAFAAGGASPWLLGLTGGLGIAIGDSIVFFLFLYTSRRLSPAWQERVALSKQKIERLPSALQYLLIYLYLGFAPIPNDILMFMLAVLRFRFVVIVPFIIAGAVTFVTLVALVGEMLPYYK